ncbi:unnamed protein product [Brassica rapa subsp. trilocularis]
MNHAVSASIGLAPSRNEKQDLKKLWCGVEMSKEGSGGGGNGAEQEEEEEKGGEEEKTEMRGGWSRKMTTAAAMEIKMMVLRCLIRKLCSTPYDKHTSLM